MTSDPIIAVAACSIGPCLVVVGLWTLVRGLRAGSVRGRVSTIRKRGSPVSYWLSISATLLTTAIGLAFVYTGIRMAQALQ